jgi:UDPglucose--hexose-1-phosphate uridylyltransferase
MAQYRKDPFSSAWVLMSPERGLKPSDFGSVRGEAKAHSPLVDSDIGDLGKEVRVLYQAGEASHAWQLRVIELASSMLSHGSFDSDEDVLFTSATSIGYQELVVEHPDPRVQWDTMSQRHVLDILKVYRDRLEVLAAYPDIKHVQITRNVGLVAGAAYAHPYGSILALPVTNRWVEEEYGAARHYHRLYERCLFCDVMAEEQQQRDRIITQNESFVAMAPYASKNPFEVWVLPLEHSSGFVSVASNALPDLASLLQDVLKAMNTALDDPPYNMIWHTFPGENDNRYHWHIEILPRLTTQAGFDWTSGLYINPTPPEDATRFLREALAMQGVVL